MQVTKIFLEMLPVYHQLGPLFSQHIFVFCYVELALPVIFVWIYDANSNTNVFSSEISIMTAGELQGSHNLAEL